MKKFKRILTICVAILSVTILYWGYGAQASDNAPIAEIPAPEEPPHRSKVYMTSDITPNGLMVVYDALGLEAEGKVAVKIST